MALSDVAHDFLCDVRDMLQAKAENLRETVNFYDCFPFDYPPEDFEVIRRAIALFTTNAPNIPSARSCAHLFQVMAWVMDKYDGGDADRFDAPEAPEVYDADEGGSVSSMSNGRENDYTLDSLNDALKLVMTEVEFIKTLIEAHKGQGRTFGDSRFYKWNPYGGKVSRGKRFQKKVKPAKGAIRKTKVLMIEHAGKA